MHWVLFTINRSSGYFQLTNACKPCVAKPKATFVLDMIVIGSTYLYTRIPFIYYFSFYQNEAFLSISPTRHSFRLNCCPFRVVAIPYYRVPNSGTNGRDFVN